MKYKTIKGWMAKSDVGMIERAKKKKTVEIDELYFEVWTDKDELKYLLGRSKIVEVEVRIKE